MTRRTVLCFGDSNTYGTAPMPQRDQNERFGASVRWPGVLAEMLGPSWLVIEEGLGGRTTVHDDPIEGASRNGKTYLLPCLGSHKPLDAIVLMLGTNDLKTRFSVTPRDIGWSIGVLMDVIEAARSGPNGARPKVLIIAPTPIDEVDWLGGIFVGAAVKSRQLAVEYAEVAIKYQASFLDAGGIIKVSPIDGVHFAADQHRLLGEAVATKVEEMFSAT